MTEANETPQNQISRRSIAKGAVWAAPVVIASQTAAFAAASYIPFPNADGPYFTDQKEVGNQTLDLNHQGNFNFIVLRGTKFPEIDWTVTITPVPNDKGKVNKDKRNFEIRDLDEGSQGEAATQSFERTNVSGPSYNPSTGSETITFSSPVTTASKGKKTLVGFRVWVGDKHSNPFDLAGSARADHVTITGVANGKTVVSYDSLDHASSDKGAAQDGRI